MGHHLLCVRLEPVNASHSPLFLTSACLRDVRLLPGDSTCLITNVWLWKTVYSYSFRACNGHFIADPLSDPLYYLKHFDFMLDSLEVDRERFLSAAQQATVVRLQRMPIELDVFCSSLSAQRNFFRTDKLDYSEIGDLNTAIHHLIEDGFLSRLSDERLDLSITMRNLTEQEEGLLQHLPSALLVGPISIKHFCRRLVRFRCLASTSFNFNIGTSSIVAS